MYLNFATDAHYHQTPLDCGAGSKACALAKMMLNELFAWKFNTSSFVKLVMNGEYKFPYMEARQFTEDHFAFAVQIALAYLVVIFGIKWLMRNREPFQLHTILIVWNFILSVFSIVATIKTGPHLIEQIWNLGLVATGCEGLNTLPSTVEYWVFLTLLSKCFEFVDTILLVLRKKPLIFLHWYHHIATFLFFSVSYPTPSSQFRMGAMLNLMVHSLMYPYYLCRAMKIKISGGVARLITVLQIAQFVFFCYGSVVMYYDLAVGKYNCDSPMIELHSASFMNGSYLLLFANFFYQSYIKKGGKDKYKMTKQE